MLRKHDEPLWRHLTELKMQPEAAQSEDELDEEPTEMNQVGSSALEAAVHPLWISMFVDGCARLYLSLETVCFIWDQCLLSEFKLLPPITAAVISLAREELLVAQTVSTICIR